MLIRLGEYERLQIKKFLYRGDSIKKIAKQLNRSFETIRREINNNGGREVYNNFKAHANALAKRRMTRNNSTHLLHLDLIAYIEKNYNPKFKSIELILKEWKDLHPNIKIPCVKTIYNWLFKGYLNIKYDQLLRPSKRRKKIIKDWKQMLGRPIFAREKEQNMDKYGHWEIDLVVGTKRNRGYIITLLERKSRFAFTAKIENKKPEIVNNQIEKWIDTYGSKIFKSITSDNGLEFSRLWEIEEKHPISFYYAFPYSSWQRGRNENWNGILRRFFPKKTDFLKVSNEELDKATNLINNMKRKILFWKSPKELFDTYVV